MNTSGLILAIVILGTGILVGCERSTSVAPEPILTTSDSNPPNCGGTIIITEPGKPSVASSRYAQVDSVHYEEWGSDMWDWEIPDNHDWQ